MATKKKTITPLFIALACIGIIGVLLISSLFTLPFLYLFLFRPYVIYGVAMHPTLKDQQFVMTRIISANDSVNRGDIVILISPTDKNIVFIKRIIGLPGETISLQNGNVYIDNKQLDESKYLRLSGNTHGQSFLKDDIQYSIPANSYFALGDNRIYSKDSRDYGPVEKTDIISEVLFCYMNCNPKTSQPSSIK